MRKINEMRTVLVLFNSFFFIGFTGYYCETQIDQCQSNPCLNGALCRTLINSFKCECPQGYTVSDTILVFLL